MSLFSIVPPLMSVGKLLRDKWDSLLAFLRNLPGAFSEGVLFLLTGLPKTWPTPLDPISISALERYWPAVCLLWLVTNAADVGWIVVYVKGGSIPNPRTPGVNNPHSAWKPFSVATYAYGYCICWLNILVWTAYFDWCFDWYRRSGRTSNAWGRSLQLLLIPLAFLMCIGPFFAPIAALPLAQQRQWTHSCNSFAGEVILDGGKNPSQIPTASFFYPSQTNNSAQPYFRYSLVQNGTGNLYPQYLVFNASASASSVPPDISMISYSVQIPVISAYCASGLCAFGNYSKEPYLSFTLHDSHTRNVTQLRAVDKEWKFPNDAPSVVLNYQNGDKQGGVALQTAVTRRNHCEMLKVCIPSKTPDFATLAPLGILLMAQQTYAQYCLLPRIYSI